MPELAYLLAADAVLFMHFVFVLFVVLGLILVLAGALLGWSWVRNPWFRLAHLAAIGVVVLQSWLGAACPLTSWELALRARAGEAVYTGSFIAHWLDSLLYYQAPAWVFAVLYTAFGILVIWTWYLLPPRSFSDQKR